MRKFIVLSLNLIAVFSLFILTSCGEKEEVALKTPSPNKCIEPFRKSYPGDQKVVYTKVMPKVGMPAPWFTGKKLDGSEVSLKSLLGKKGLFLFFCRKKCSSMKKWDNFQSIIPQLAKNGISSVAIISDEGDDAFAAFKIYAEKMTIIPDREDKIFNQYVVTGTPYFYLIDNCGTIFLHRSFTKRSALNAMSGHLNQSRIKDSFNVQGAG